MVGISKSSYCNETCVKHETLSVPLQHSNIHYFIPQYDSPVEVIVIMAASSILSPLGEKKNAVGVSPASCHRVLKCQCDGHKINWSVEYCSHSTGTTAVVLFRCQ